jgi:ribonuclease P protein subunit RPR2
MNPNSSHRINFLVQASEAVVKTNPDLSQYYGRVMTTLGEKSSTKMDFTIKRRICKKCLVALVPGLNCTFRIKKKKSRKGHPTQVITCQSCSTSQCLILKRNYKLKSETHGKITKLTVK